MRGGETFQQVLESRLTAEEPAPQVERPPDPAVLFTSTQQYVRFHTFSPGPRPAQASTAARSRTRQPGAAALAGRGLTPRQRQALDSFLALGVGLAEDFTATDLRQAFRTLARRYHPDRHPERGAGEKSRLSRLFAEINEHHGQLMAALAPR